MPAEYKQVTVLFADVVRSMDVAAAVGVERLREIMTELINRSAAVVRRYGGTLDKFTGDGVMAVFGAPAALEDHALRACLAALGIQDEAKGLAAEVGQHDGVDLNLRVGLNSGRVVAGEIGSVGLTYTSVGEEVGMAHRLESIAPPGAVMLSASTARLVEDAATLGEAQRVQIKGSDEPVVAPSAVGYRRRAAAELLLGVDIGGPEAGIGCVGFDARCSMLDARCSMLDARCSMLDARCSMLDARCSMLDARCSMLDARCSMLDRSIAGHGSVAGVSGPAGAGQLSCTQKRG